MRPRDAKIFVESRVLVEQQLLRNEIAAAILGDLCKDVLTIFLVPLSNTCTTVSGNLSASFASVQSAGAFATNPRSTHGTDRLTCSR